MAKYLLKKLQRGPTLNLNFSVMRQKSDNIMIVTDIINVDNLALVLMTFQGNNGNLKLGIEIKKNEQAKNLTVPMIVASGNFVKQFYCSDEWVQSKLPEKPFGNSMTFNAYSNGYNKTSELLLYNFEVDITIQAMAPVPIPSMVAKQQYEDTEFTDYKMAAPDGTVPVHKSILAVHSDMLRTMLLCGEWKESKEGVINVKGVTVETLQQLKRYMYLGILPDDSMDLGLLLLIASYYLMDKLKADCIAKVVKSVRAEDFEILIEFACQNNMPDLMKAILFQTPYDTVTDAYKLDIENKMSKDE